MGRLAHLISILPVSGTPGVECRTGPYAIVFTFSNNLQNVQSARVSVGTGSVSSYTWTSNACTVNLAGIINQQNVVVTLQGVHDSKDFINVAVPMTVLVGDTN